MNISGKGNRLMISHNGKRCGIYISTGPWVQGVNPDLIKIWVKKGLRFPKEIREGFEHVENNSDGMTDYFESDTVRLLPGNPLYDQAKQAANA